MYHLKEKNDCDLLLNDVENVFGSIGKCIDAAIDEKKSKWEVTKEVFGIGSSLMKFGFTGTKCLVRNTPKALATVASVKREITDTISEEYVKFQKEQKEEALEEKIKQLSYRKNNDVS